MTSNEKKGVDDLVDTMIKYNLSYKSWSDQGNATLQIDPPIDKFHQYGTNVSPTTLFGDDMRQIISHEIQMEKIRRSTVATSLEPKKVVKPSAVPDNRGKSSKEAFGWPPKKADTTSPKENVKIVPNINNQMNTLFERYGI